MTGGDRGTSTTKGGNSQLLRPCIRQTPRARWGEAAALRAGRVDLGRRRLEIVEATSEVGGEIIFGTPKTHQRRSVPFPRF